MSKKVLVVIGAGPSIGMGMALRFGREGYAVALVSRNRQKLDDYVSQLKDKGVEAAGFTADVCNRPQLIQAMSDIQKKFGRVDVLEYSPLVNMADLQSAITMDLDSVQFMLDFQLLGAITATQCVLDGMIARGDGSLLYTTGASAIVPLPSHANAGVAVAGLRQYAYMLNMAVASKGIYVGTISIAKPHTGDEIADLYWDMLTKRDRVEEIYGDRNMAISVSCYEEMLWAPGYADTYPRKLNIDPPPPANEQERKKLLLALYHLRCSASRPNVPNREATIAKADSLAKGLGGDITAPFYGVPM